MYYKELAERSSYLKNPKESEADMQDIIELYAEKKAKEAAKKAAEEEARKAEKMVKEAEKKTARETAREYVCKLLKGGLPVEKVAALLDMSKAQVEALAEGSHTA